MRQSTRSRDRRCRVSVVVAACLGDLLLAQRRRRPPAAAQPPRLPRGQSHPSSTGANRRKTTAGSALAGRPDPLRRLPTAEDKGASGRRMFGILDPILEYSKRFHFSRGRRRSTKIARANELEPHARCQPSGVARQFLTPYGVEFVELPEPSASTSSTWADRTRFRMVYMDGRTHPPRISPPSYYGHSIGWWEGDTLVVDTIGFNERFWLDRRGLPHTDQLHTIERFTRISERRHEVRSDHRRSRAPTRHRGRDGSIMRFNAGSGAVRVRLPAGQLRARADGRRSFDSMDRTTTIVP